MSTKRQRRGLSEEEKILWHRVGRTVTPLQGRIAALPAGIEASEREFLEAMAAGEKPGPKAAKTAPGPGFAEGAKPPSFRREPRPEPHIDRPTTKKLAKGRLSIDARIDLHAMTQDQAHDRLYVFLADARSRGARHVLVVTGKGRSLGSEGVLKRMVPIWLGSARFAGLVSGYASASRHHGGEGAIYIRLRRLARPDGSVEP